jgi:Flp pilus assembly pilin Flp
MIDPAATAPRREQQHGALLVDRSGAVVLEYALIAAMVAITAMAAMILFGDSATRVWTTIASEVGGALGGG